MVLGTGEDAAPAAAVRVALPRLGIPERREVLAAALRRHVAPRAVSAAQAATAATVFDLSVPDVELAAEDVARGHALWAACRARARSRFGALAHVLEPRAGWDDLVLPERSARSSCARSSRASGTGHRARRLGLRRARSTRGRAPRRCSPGRAAPARRWRPR